MTLKGDLTSKWSVCNRSGAFVTPSFSSNHGLRLLRHYNFPAGTSLQGQTHRDDLSCKESPAGNGSSFCGRRRPSPKPSFFLCISNQFNKAAHAAEHMELRVAIKDGLLDHFTHKLMKMTTSYISATYQIWPIGMDLEGAAFELADEELCRKIIDDVKRRFRRQLKYIEVECL